MSAVVRKVPAETFYRVARSTLARMACEVADPTDKHHRHADCVRDDESFVAERLLVLAAAIATGNVDRALDELSDLMEGVREPK